ncbi:MAG: prepilin-type N-terminal cleavage/methylation domain-containing protein, partial [Alphaproteobacteria bacterium]
MFTHISNGNVIMRSRHSGFTLLEMSIVIL